MSGWSAICVENDFIWKVPELNIKPKIIGHLNLMLITLNVLSVRQFLKVVENRFQLQRCLFLKCRVFFLFLLREETYMESGVLCNNSLIRLGFICYCCKELRFRWGSVPRYVFNWFSLIGVLVNSTCEYWFNFLKWGGGGH